MAFELSSGELGEHTTCNGIKERGPRAAPIKHPSSSHLPPHTGMAATCPGPGRLVQAGGGRLGSGCSTVRLGESAPHSGSHSSPDPRRYWATCPARPHTSTRHGTIVIRLILPQVKPSTTERRSHLRLCSGAHGHVTCGPKELDLLTLRGTPLPSTHVTAAGGATQRPLPTVRLCMLRNSPEAQGLGCGLTRPRTAAAAGSAPDSYRPRGNSDPPVLFAPWCKTLRIREGHVPRGPGRRLTAPGRSPLMWHSHGQTGGATPPSTPS